MSILRNINPRVRGIRYSEHESLVRRANQIEVELQQGVKKPYTELIVVCWGDSHNAGMKPISFIRQVIAACVYPELLQRDGLPADAKARAQKLLRECAGGSLGSYTDSCGLHPVRQSVADFIMRRDRGVPSSPDDIFLSSGSQMALIIVLKLLVHGEGSHQTGVLTPVPTFFTFTMALDKLGAAMVPYHLCEEEGWTLQVEELHRVIQACRRHCSPRVLYIINPGNPTGHVQSRKSIEEVIRFAADEKLFLLADEVYQDCMHEGGREFVSYKRVLFEMGPPYSDTVQLASFHSVSKGFIGECGLRAGYVELINIDPDVKEVTQTLFSTESCSAVIGQIALQVMVDPPQPGEPSHLAYTKEIQANKETLVCNARQVQGVLRDLPGVSYQPVMGGLYVFPRLHLPPRAVEQAQKEGVEADMLYCRRLLEEEGVCVGAGCFHGQKEGTHHIRLCIMTPTKVMEETLRRLKNFHFRFMSEFS